MKKQQKYCLEGECEEIDTQNGRNNQQQETHQEPTKACFEQFSGKRTKQWVFRPDLNKGLEIPLIWSLYWKSIKVSN